MNHYFISAIARIRFFFHFGYRTGDIFSFFMVACFDQCYYVCHVCGSRCNQQLCDIGCFFNIYTSEVDLHFLYYSRICYDAASFLIILFYLWNKQYLFHTWRMSYSYRAEYIDVKIAL